MEFFVSTCKYCHDPSSIPAWCLCMFERQQIERELEQQAAFISPGFTTEFVINRISIAIVFQSCDHKRVLIVRSLHRVLFEQINFSRASQTLI